jgi:hypothetical protein
MTVQDDLDLLAAYLVPAHIDMTKEVTMEHAGTRALARVRERIAQLEAALRTIQKFQPRRLEWYREQGIVFENAMRPSDDPSEWEVVAFWTYTDLCEIESIARAVSQDGEQR